MPNVTDDEIYDELTTAFTQRCQRALTEKGGKPGLREFIRVSVINGHHKDPKLYPLCSEYLKCRFESMADVLNGGNGGVTWTDVTGEGTAEVKRGTDTPCVSKLSPEYWAYIKRTRERRLDVDDSGPGDEAVVAFRDLRLCAEYDCGDLQPPPGGID